MQGIIEIWGKEKKTRIYHYYYYYSASDWNETLNQTAMWQWVRLGCDSERLGCETERLERDSESDWDVTVSQTGMWQWVRQGVRLGCDSDEMCRESNGAWQTGGLWVSQTGELWVSQTDGQAVEVIRSDWRWWGKQSTWSGESGL
jgi:hypothetical protein